MTTREAALANRIDPDRRPHLHPGRWRRLKARPWWPWVSRGAVLAFFALVVTLLVIEARNVHWGEVIAAIRRMPWSTLSIAMALVCTSHLLYSCYDLVGKLYTKHTLPTVTVLAATFVSYAFNLNMGALVGGAGMRFRLYLQLGLRADSIARILSLAMLTNWLGYMLLAGVALLLHPVALPFGWTKLAGVVDGIGVLLILVPLSWLAACAFSRRRIVQVRGHRLELPSFRIAVLQLLVSCANWLVMAGIIYTLLQQRVDFAAVLTALLAAAVAGVISHVPAGIGVLEAVFVTLLSSQVPKEELLAVLLTYRAIYYLLPLLIAVVMYFAFEARMKYNRSRGALPR